MAATTTAPSSPTAGNGPIRATESSASAENSEAHIKECLQVADDLKKEATENFKADKWAQALALYRSALGRVPKRRAALKRDGGADDQEALDDDDEIGTGHLSPEQDEGPEEAPPLSGLELECANVRAILNANIGACHVKLGEHKEAVEVCTEALIDDPKYVKALQRRASSNESIATWASLASAEEDYNTLLKILPSDSPLVARTGGALQSVRPRMEAAQKKETAEMMSKLKGLGNSILGNFGLSTENFKFEPNGQGGYSMNFVR